MSREVTVEDVPGTKFQQKNTAGPLTWTPDEPEEDGGDDAGPTPYDMLLSALGSCTSMTLRLYADRKKWPLERVQVVLRHDRVHARDCATCEQDDPNAWVDIIERRIRVSGPLDEDQLARLLEIANKCPVHRTLTSTIHVKTMLGGDRVERSA